MTNLAGQHTIAARFGGIMIQHSQKGKIMEFPANSTARYVAYGQDTPVTVVGPYTHREQAFPGMYVIDVGPTTYAAPYDRDRRIVHSETLRTPEGRSIYHPTDVTVDTTPDAYATDAEMRSLATRY